MITNINPWISMWTNPRTTIRAIVNLNPNHGVFLLAWIFVLHTFFFSASYWSFGLRFSFYAILATGVILSPFLGWIWLYFTGWLYHFTGRWLGGQAPMAHLRASVAWSKIPFILSLFMWLILMITGPQTVFVNGVSETSSVFVGFIIFVLQIWSFVLLFQSIREVQGFTLARTLLNILFAWILFWFINFLLLFTFRYFYSFM